MVRFENKLRNNAVQEWAREYLDYARLKRILQTPVDGSSTDTYRSPYFSSAAEPGFASSPSSGEHKRREDDQRVPLLSTDEGGDFDRADMEGKSSLSDSSESGLAANVQPVELPTAAAGAGAAAGAATAIPHRRRGSALESLHAILDPHHPDFACTIVDVDGNHQLLARDKRFRSALLEEIAKVESFFKEKTRYLTRRLELLEARADEDKSLGTTRKRRIMLKRQQSLSSPPPASDLARKVQERGARKASRGAGSHGVDMDLESLAVSDSPSRELLRRESSKRDYADVYRQMMFLENFGILNYTAVVKIAKKHDKLLPTKISDSVKAALSSSSCTFHSRDMLKNLISRHQHLYGQVFCGGSSELARAELLMKRNDDKESGTRPFLLGFRVGACLLLLAWIIWDVVVDFALNETAVEDEFYARCHPSLEDRNKTVVVLWFRKQFPVYRGMATLILWLWCWGVLLWAWNRARINYLFMLELDPRFTATYGETWEVASSLTIVLFASFIIHFKVVRCDFPRNPPLGFWPMIPFVYLVYKLFFPWRERKQAWKVVRDVVMSPLVEVTFLMNYVGDVFTSLAKPFVDVSYAICFFVTGDFLQHLGEEGVCQNAAGFWSTYVVPVLLILPYWFRFLQCLRRYVDTGKRHPNLPNALKYALAMCITVFAIFNPSLKKHVSGDSTNTYQVAWTIAYFISTLYTYSWDVLMDWSLGDREHGMLRQRRMLRPSFYYVAIVGDLVLRFLWTYTLIPERDQSSFTSVGLANAVAPFAAMAEVVRRSMWSVFRLENEHLNNTAGYRKVDHIPLHFDTPLKRSIKDNKKKRGWLVVAEIGLLVVTVIVVCVVAVVTKG